MKEQNMDFYITFVDLTKEFDRVTRDGLRKRLSNQVSSNGAAIAIGFRTTESTPNRLLQQMESRKAVYRHR